MRVKLLAPRGTHPAGAEIDMPDDQARQLVKAGGAEEVRRAGDHHGDDGQKFMSLRFRRTATLGGTTYQANALAAVEQTAEAWDLVDKGAADLEPGPGVNNQPFPPDRLTQSAVEPARTAARRGKERGEAPDEAAPERPAAEPARTPPPDVTPQPPVGMPRPEAPKKNR